MQVALVTHSQSDMDIRDIITYQVNVVPTPEGGKQMEVVLETKRATLTFQGGIALQLTDLLASLLDEFAMKATALDIEEGNYG